VENLEQNKPDTDTEKMSKKELETKAEEPTSEEKDVTEATEDSTEEQAEKPTAEVISSGEKEDVKSEEVEADSAESTEETDSENEKVEEEPEEKETSAENAPEDVKEDTAGSDEEAKTENDVAETAASETEETADTSTKGEAEEVDEEEANTFYADIVTRAKELVVQTDWAFVTTELSNMAHEVSEGPESVSEKAKKLIAEFEELRENFEEKKRKHYEELNKKKEENLAKRKELLKSLSNIINEENWTATKEIGQIKGKWESAKLLPQGEAEALEKRFKELMDEFEDHKVDRLVKKLEKEEENLELKLLLLDKMDGTVQKLDENTSNFEELEGAFNKLISQWRKVGRVPSEKNQALWNRFNAVQDTFNELRFKFDKKYRESIEKALEKKKKLVKEAQALVDQDNIAQAARKVNKLHKRWKKAGNLPQKEENEMWDLFKAATDKFNELKSDNLDVLRKQEEENLTKKHALIEKAVEAKDTDNFDAGHQTMQNLMSQWKKIGPVPRKKSSKIWKQFKGAMDVFYDRRREAFKGQRKDQKENLARKEQILEKLAELGKHEDPALAVQEAKKLQEEFKDAGYVPIKVKNKIWKQYREACDVIYDRYRSLGADLGMEKKLANQGIDPDTRKDIIKYQKERDKLKKDVSKLESEMIQYEEAQTYFKPTNKGNALKDELQQKIDKAEKSIEEKQDRLSELRKQIDQLKRSGDNNDEEE
jgi:HAMP domain-containing protein